MGGAIVIGAIELVVLGSIGSKDYNRDTLLSLKGIIVPSSPSKSESYSRFFRVSPSFIGLIASIILIKEVLVIALLEGI